MIGAMLALTFVAMPAQSAPAPSGPEISVTPREPTIPDQSEQAFTVRCGNQTLRISGYGFARPEGERVSLLANGRNIDGADELRRDLSNRRAVYRLFAGCSQLSHQITVGLRTLERWPTGEVVVHSAQATFRGANLEYYSGFQLGTLDDFAFR